MTTRRASPHSSASTWAASSRETARNTPAESKQPSQTLSMGHATEQLPLTIFTPNTDDDSGPQTKTGSNWWHNTSLCLPAFSAISDLKVLSPSGAQSLATCPSESAENQTQLDILSPTLAMSPFIHLFIILTTKYFFDRETLERSRGMHDPNP